MITGILMAMLGTALVAVLVAMVRGPSAGVPLPPPTPQPQPVSPPAPADVLELDAWDAKANDIVSIAGAAEDFGDLDFTVVRRGAYEAANHRWIRLEGSYRGRMVDLEIYRYPGAQILGFFDVRRLSLPEVGTTEERLVEIDEKQDPTLTIAFQASNWAWVSSREIRYFANEAGGAGDGIYRWLFAEQGGPRVLCIEKREGEPFEGRLGKKIEKRDVTVYRS